MTWPKILKRVLSMSSPESEDTAEAQPFLTPRQRRHPVELSSDPTDDEMSRDWTLSTADRELVFHALGDARGAGARSSSALCARQAG